MYQENPVSTVMLNPEEGKAIQVRYCLTEEDYQGELPHAGYGVCAKLYLADKLVDESSVSDVTCSKSEMITLIEALSRNTVTPVTLRDVIEDYISC
jgi:hypothetical protein